MTVGINCLYMIPGGVGGTEIYLRQLLEALSNVDPDTRYVLFANRETPDDWFPVRSNFQVVRCRVRAVRRPSRILFEQLYLPWMLVKHGISVLLNPGFTAPIACRVPMVTVVHDLQHKRHPEFFRRSDLPFWQLLVYLAVVRSRQLIAVSKTTAADLAHFYGTAASRKTVVIPHGVDQAFHRMAAERTTSSSYILCVSTLHPHKNLIRLLNAFQTFVKKKPQFRLIVAGLKGFAAQLLEEEKTRLQLGDRVQFTGWIARGELLDLYRNAKAFIYPSLFEGFGMPVLEARAAGLPLACSRIPPLIEIAGEHAILFDPLDVRAIADAMEKITANCEPLRNSVAEYTWESCARKTFDVLRAAVQTD